jgi:ribosome biogenesis protein MAK21
VVLRARKREGTSGMKKKKLRSLPTFSSPEDYAKLIEDGSEDDISKYVTYLFIK